MSGKVCMFCHRYVWEDGENTNVICFDCIFGVELDNPE